MTEPLKRLKPPPQSPKPQPLKRLEPPKPLQYNVSSLGQVFTSAKIVKSMLSLRKHKGSILEPAAGNGAFLQYLEKSAVGIELDNRFSNDKRILQKDFFDYFPDSFFDTIIGNPPYVSYKRIDEQTKKLLPASLFDRRTNLYLFFMDKCIDLLNPLGELIFITPRDFLKATSAKKLNERLFNDGSFTHYFELGDARLFAGYAPNCAIWRWEKGRQEKKLATGGEFVCTAGQIYFKKQQEKDKQQEKQKETGKLGDYFDVKVGAVSGADAIFTSKKGNTSFVCSTTRKDRQLRKMIYNERHKSLLPHKEKLLQRRIKKFTANNWWEWGRKYYHIEGERIYVNCKTRTPKPFFQSEDAAYDGSVLALIPKEKVSLAKALKKLNHTNWEALGFVCGGRALFTQRSLYNLPIEL